MREFHAVAIGDPGREGLLGRLVEDDRARMNRVDANLVAVVERHALGEIGDRLDEPRQARLAQALEQGPAAHGFDKDQRWTLARVADLIARLFHVRYSLRGVSYLLHRMGFSPQVPAHRAIERDEDATIITWRRETWPAGKR